MQYTATKCRFSVLRCRLYFVRDDCISSSEKLYFIRDELDKQDSGVL